MARAWGCLARAGASGRARSAGSQERVPGVSHQIVGVVEGEELATRSKLMRRAGSSLKLHAVTQAYTHRSLGNSCSDATRADTGGLLSRRQRSRAGRHLLGGVVEGPAARGGEDRRCDRGAPEREAARRAAAGVPDHLADRRRATRAAGSVCAHSLPVALSAIRQPGCPAPRLREEHRRCAGA